VSYVYSGYIVSFVVLVGYALSISWRRHHLDD